jgi:hypothetical protein
MPSVSIATCEERLGMTRPLRERQAVYIRHSNCATGWMNRSSYLPQGKDNFLFSIMPRSTQPPIQWVQLVVTTGVKLQEREADHLHQEPRLRMRGAIPLLLFLWCLINNSTSTCVMHARTGMYGKKKRGSGCSCCVGGRVTHYN